MCKFRSVTFKTKMKPKNRRRRLPTVREEPKNSDFMINVMVVTTAVLSYCNSFNGDFVHDDISAIVLNGDVTGSNALKELFLNDFWGTPMADADSHKSYRPLTTLSFRLNHILSGLRPWWWHACNVALHAACCVLVARACVTVARLQRPFAALAALLFSVHPIHTEAVAGLVGRADVLACIFFLSSLLVYHRHSDSKKCVWMSIGLGTLSTLAKETGITVLLVNLVFDFYRCWPFVKRSITSMKVQKKCTHLSVRVIKVVASLALLICLRLALLQGTWPTFSAQDNQTAFHPSFFVRLMTFCYLAAFNWWLVLCPWTLCHDWQMGSVPLVTSGWDPRNLLTCAALMTLLAITIRCYSDFEVQRHTPAVIGLLLLVIPFLPATNLLVTVGFVVAERVLYIPSVGSVILTAYGVQLMWYSKPGMKTYLMVGLAVLATCGVVKTYWRNADWRDRGTLLKADLVILPQNAKLHYNFANFLRETEQQDAAIKHYKEALSLWPTYASAYNNMGTLITKPDVAEQHFLQAIKINKYHMNAHFNLAKLYKKTGKIIKAVSLLEKCILMKPKYVPAHLELLTLMPWSSQHRILMTLVQLEPHNWEHFVLYGNWWKERGFPGLASRFYLEATRLNFKHRVTSNPRRGFFVSFRNTALMYRALGQKSRTLQLLTRWHTWRRGWLNPSAIHVTLSDWKLKLEVMRRAQDYSMAITTMKTMKCIDHNQLTVDSKPEKRKVIDGTIVLKPKKDACVCVDAKSACKDCGTKNRDSSQSETSQLKTIYNESGTGLEDQECGLSENDKGDVELLNMCLAEKIRMKTF